MPYTKEYRDTLYNREWLERVYLQENRNAEQVAKMIGCTRQAVHAWLKRFKIPIKGRSVAQQVSDLWTGTSADRPRSEFKDTLHNVVWLKEQALSGNSIKSIAELAGCSGPGLYKALERENLADLWRAARQQFIIDRREKKRGKPHRPLRKGRTTEQTARSEARLLVPDRPCAVCFDPITEVNHKDRNHFNNDLDNLERLCKRCHSRQHAMESRIAFAILAKRGITIRNIHDRAQKKLMKGRWVPKKASYSTKPR